MTLGDKCFKQEIGIPMGTDCAPLLANLFLYAYEYQWIVKKVKEKKIHLLKKFKGCCRYIDDLLLINNDLTMEKVKSQIYPKELILVPDDNNGLNTPFLDRMININDSLITTHIYDKRDIFNFPIISFPILSGNIPLSSSYGVVIGEWVRYARACTLYKHFKERSILLIRKLKKQFYTQEKLRRTWTKFCNSHLMLILKYASQILNHHKDWSNNTTNNNNNTVTNSINTTISSNFDIPAILTNWLDDNPDFLV